MVDDNMADLQSVIMKDSQYLKNTDEEGTYDKREMTAMFDQINVDLYDMNFD